MDEKQERRQLSSRRGNQSDVDIREHCGTACDIQLSRLTCQGKLLFTETSANLRNITLHMAGYRVSRDLHFQQFPDVSRELLFATCWKITTVTMHRLRLSGLRVLKTEKLTASRVTHKRLKLQIIRYLSKLSEHLINLIARSSINLSALICFFSFSSYNDLTDTYTFVEDLKLWRYIKYLNRCSLATC